MGKFICHNKVNLFKQYPSKFKTKELLFASVGDNDFSVSFLIVLLVISVRISPESPRLDYEELFWRASKAHKTYISYYKGFDVFTILFFIFNKVQSLTSQIFLIKQFSTQRKDLVKWAIVANIKPGIWFSSLGISDNV